MEAAALVVGDPAFAINSAAAAPSETRRVAQQMPMLDPQMQAVIDELMSLEAPKITDMTPFNARQTSPLSPNRTNRRLSLSTMSRIG